MGIRTPDTLLKRQVLCLLSYWGIPYSNHTTTNTNMDLLLRGRAGKRIWSQWAQAKPVPSYGMKRARSDVAGTAGLEPTISESKSGVLPLHYVPPYGEGIGITPNPFLSMGWVKGLEPSTPGTTIRCSNQLSYTHHIKQWHAKRDSNPRPTA